MEGVIECPYRLHEIINNGFLPFEINDSFKTPFSEIDPDYHFYTSMYLQPTWNVITILKTISGINMDSLIRVNCLYFISISNTMMS